MTLYAHDCHENHGRIWFGWPWRHLIFTLEPPPTLVRDYEMRSMVWISKRIEWGCFWTGRLFLGMKDYYEEYTPREETNRADVNEMEDDMHCATNPAT
jgi:hypothetical protein